MSICEIEKAGVLENAVVRNVRTYLDQLRSLWPFELSRPAYEAMARDALHKAYKRGLLTYSEWTRLYHSYVEC